VIRHRFRAPVWRWWPGAVGGALPHVVVVIHLLTGGTWAAAMFVEVWVMVATVGVTLVLACLRPGRGAALALLGAGAIGLGVVVSVAYLGLP
jgi:hypothetical protein